MLPFIVLAIALSITGFICMWVYNNTVKNIKLKKQSTEISLAIDKLNIKNIELEQFSYMAAHDLQSPLRNILNISYITQDIVE